VANRPAAPVADEWETVKSPADEWETVASPSAQPAYQYGNLSPAPTEQDKLQKDDPQIGRAPVTKFLDDLENDLRQGGNRTFLGRALGKAQGRGDKGYSGLESGTSKGAADFMGSVPLGLVKTAQGLADLHDHPVKGALKTLGGVMQTGTIPGMMVGGPTAEGAAELLPSRSFASGLFKDVMENAHDVPVNLSRSGDAILRAKEISDAGTSMPQSIGKLLRRVTDPDKPPITYKEARDFYTNISSLSANESTRLSPVMKRQIGMIASALKDDIGEAAGQAGKASEYYSAMKNYAQAAKLKRAAETMGKWLVAGAGLGGAVEGGLALKKIAK
jgi:hypothetical protein